MKKLVKLLLSCSMMFSLVACSSGDSSSTSDAIKLGGSGPLTGAAAVYGTAVMNAAQLAVDEINEKEGKTYFEFKFEDDEADATKSPNAYGSLKDWGMQVSIYTTTSGAGAAVAEDYYNDRIFAITPSGSNTSLIYTSTTNYDNLFQVCFTDPNLGVASADYMAGNPFGLGSLKVGIIYKSDDDYSTSIYNTFKAECKEKGVGISYEGSFTDSTSTDFSTQLQACMDNNCDIVFLPIYYTPAATILTQASSMNYSPVFFGVDGMDGILSLEGFDTKLAEGVYLLTPFAADATDDATVSFVNKYVELYGETPNQFAADAYDAVYAIYQACKAGNVTASMSASEICDILVKQFTSMTFEGLTGTATWSTNGEVSKSPKAVVIENGVYVAAE